MAGYYGSFIPTQPVGGINFAPQQPQMQIQPQQQPQVQASPNPMLILISSEDEMRNYPVAAGTTVILVAFNLGKFWLKATDTSGVPQAPREFTFVEKTPEPPAAPITREEFTTLSEQVKKLIEELGGTK